MSHASATSLQSRPTSFALPDLFGAKLVGRFKSGAPLEVRKFTGNEDGAAARASDPGESNPALGNDNTVNNNFEYGDDANGDVVPRAAHIRKVYPRDQTPEHELANLPISETMPKAAPKRTVFCDEAFPMVRHLVHPALAATQMRIAACCLSAISPIWNANLNLCSGIGSTMQISQDKTMASTH